MWNCVHCVHRTNSSSFHRTAFLWSTTQQAVVIPYRYFRTTHWSHILGLRWDPMGCPKPSVRNYHSSLRNSPEARGSHLVHSGILKLYGSCFDIRCLVSGIVYVMENFFVVTLCTVVWITACDMHSWEQGFCWITVNLVCAVSWSSVHTVFHCCCMMNECCIKIPTISTPDTNLLLGHSKVRD
jgi:hypothetical protein